MIYNRHGSFLVRKEKGNTERKSFMAEIMIGLIASCDSLCYVFLPFYSLLDRFAYK